MTESGNTTTAPRRRTLKTLLGAAAGAALASGGFVWWGTRRPEVSLMQSQCARSGSMNQKVLIVYASRAGSTAEIADVIAKQLCAAGLSADVRPVAEVRTLDGYAAAIVGSAVRYGSWLPEMLKFMEREKAALQRVPVAFFTVCMKARNPSTVSQQEMAQYATAARAVLMPKAETFFAGKIDLATLSFFDRLAVKIVKSPVADLRDWAAIRAWASSLKSALALPA
jgi:menaquinone-dependent protoporphyrinogen oxidase